VVVYSMRNRIHPLKKVIFVSRTKLNEKLPGSTIGGLPTAFYTLECGHVLERPAPTEKAMSTGKLGSLRCWHCGGVSF
jgi:hypothetical protein